MTFVGDVVKATVGMARGFTRERVEGAMTSTVQIKRGNPATLDDDGVLTPDPDSPVVYEGPARLTPATGPVSYTVGEEVQFFSSGACTIPVDLDEAGEVVPVDIRVNDMLYVTAGDDPAMVGRNFRVVDVEVLGLLTGFRRLQIVGVQRYPGWIDSAVRHPVTGQVPDVVPPEWMV